NLAFYDTERKLLKVRTLWDCTTTNSLLVIRDGLTVITATEEEIPEDNSLVVYPNPSQANTNLTFETIIKQTADYEIEIFNMAGTSIYKQDLGRILENEPLKHRWNSQNIRGVLIVKLKNNLGKVVSKKIIIE
uniref:T9SS type A sorting domain-containing protein n=1 Tax=Emticicia sp. TaxID=1930953 RepID=UPI003BA55B69